MSAHAPHPSDWCWHPRDWEMAAEDSVQDARERTRAQAHARFCGYEFGWNEVGVWKRYARALDRQERYEHWVEDQEGGWDEHPDHAPEDWDGAPYDEGVPVWALCHRDHPDAIPVWICGLRADGPPHRPTRPKTPPTDSGGGS